MKKFLVLTIVVVSLSATTLRMEEFRKEERILVLKEFKDLYAKRKHLYRYSSQALGVARSKVLQKKRLSLFQPKNEGDVSGTLFQTENKHPIENSNVFLTNIETEDFIVKSDGSLTDVQESSIADSDVSISSPEFANGVESVPLRSRVVNPWIKR